MKSLIIGRGEVGEALFEVVRPYHSTFIRDVGECDLPSVEVMHICFPDSDDFIDEVKRYQQKYKPNLTIIHSSVAVGTTEEIGGRIVYSPIRGRHRPKLSVELKFFPKFIACSNKRDSDVAVAYFKECGWDVFTTRDIVGTELVKMLSNIHMGVEIAWAQEVDRILKHFKGNPSTYEKWEESYNAGYFRVLQPHMMRPIMRPDPIGGHCILECIEILRQQFSSPIFEFVRSSNEEVKKNHIQKNGKGSIEIRT